LKLFARHAQDRNIFADVDAGQAAEAAVLGFNNSVDKLKDFTTNHETILSTISHN